MISLLNWFEIPVSDLERAVNFYGNVFGFHMHEADLSNGEGVFIMNEDHQADGALIKGEGYTPSKDGSVIYLDCGEDLQPILDKVTDNGGKILAEKKLIDPNMGYYAFIEDTEGNRVGLHSPN